MSGRIVIPIADESGRLIAYAGRAVDDSEPKYKFPSGFKKSLVLWNIDRLQNLPEQSDDPLIIVEGFFDCMKLHQAGFVGVVALMGCGLSEVQQQQLARFRQVVLMLDGDAAGQAGVESILPRLARTNYVRVVTPPGQPDELSIEDIQEVLRDL